MQLKDVPRLRTRRDEDDLTIAFAVRKPFKNDHLCEDQGKEKQLQNRFGVYWVRQTPKAAKYAESCYRRWLREHDTPIMGEQVGDYDGILWFEATNPDQIPEWFRKSAGKVAVGQATRMKHV